MEWMLMPLRRYAEFSGRSRRKEYWMFVLGVILLYIILMVLFMGMVGGAAFSGGANPAALASAGLGAGLIGIIIMLVWLALLVPSLAVGVRRLHDINRSGWWLMLGYGPWLASVVLSLAQSATLAGMLNLLSMVGFLVLFVFAVMDGTKGPNQYGEDPKGPDHAKVFA